MGHNISALIAKTPIDMEAAQTLDLPVILEGGYAIVALLAEHIDHWTQVLGLPYGLDTPIMLDCLVTHEFARRLGLDQYALIETNYWGGNGTQYAAVYRCGVIEMPHAEGGINTALRMLGVVREDGKDEFDTINLANYRDFYGLFKSYRGE